jgi:hypothetical protein
MHYERHKAYLEFKGSYNIHTKISLGVYFALMIKRIQMNSQTQTSLTLPLALSNRCNQQILEAINKEKSRESVNYERSFTSRLTIEGTKDTLSDPTVLFGQLVEFRITITEIDSFGHFWAQVNEDKYLAELDRIQSELNSPYLKLEKVRPPDLCIGKIVATSFIVPESLETSFYRGKIVEFKSEFKSCEVYFIDYGNSEVKDVSLIFELPEKLKKISHQAFECNLTKIRLNPFIADCPKKTKDAVEHFAKILKSTNELKAKVYSVVDSVVNVDLIDLSSSLYESDIALNLVKLGLCERCEESAISVVKLRRNFNAVYFLLMLFLNKIAAKPL